MSEHVTTRRVFFKDVVRGTGIASIVALSTTLIGRHGDPTCINQGLCRGCQALTSCGLPPALNEKKEDGRRTKRNRR